MKQHKIILLTFLIIAGISFTACNKEWLDSKPDSRLSVLTTTDEYSKLMDNSALYITNLFPQFGTDEFYVSATNLNAIDAQNVSYYTWAPTGLALLNDTYWQTTYLNIFTCNTVINGLAKIPRTESNQKVWDATYGAAHFYRAILYFQLAEVFIKPYNAATAASDDGIPIRTEPDVSQKVGRGTVQEVYDQIFADLNYAKGLLPTTFDKYKNRPSKNAVYCYLSRIYMSMGNYENAKKYSDSALAIKDVLLDYNTVTSSSTTGFNSISFLDNPEVVFDAANYVGSTILDILYMRVDSTLYRSYNINDLRRSIFFRARETNAFSFKGTYQGQGQSSATYFMAPATDEMYLNRAECNARSGQLPAAMDDLNALLSKRWKKGTFTPHNITNAQNALDTILLERKKELLMRGTRWSDLRRLNNDPRLAITIKRIYKGQTYSLAPGSNLYTWPLPNDEIILGGLRQNPR